MQEMKEITHASYVLQDQTVAHNIPEIYEKGTTKIKGLIEKWDIFKCANYLIIQTVNKRELLALYKPTETAARKGFKERISLPVQEYEKLKGKIK